MSFFSTYWRTKLGGYWLCFFRCFCWLCAKLRLSSRCKTRWASPEYRMCVHNFISSNIVCKLAKVYWPSRARRVYSWLDSFNFRRWFCTSFEASLVETWTTSVSNEAIQAEGLKRDCSTTKTCCENFTITELKLKLKIESLQAAPRDCREAFKVVWVSCNSSFL